MFNLDVLDVAIGLSFVYLVLSLVMSTIRESIEGVRKARGRYLEQAIGELLGDDSVRRHSWRRKLVTGLDNYGRRIRDYRAAHSGRPVRARLVPLGRWTRHRVVTAWSRFWKGRTADPDSRVTQFYRHPLITGLYRGDYQPRGRNLPSYIPSGNFAQAVIDIQANAPAGAVAAAGNHPAPEMVRLATEAAQAKADAAQAVVAATPDNTLPPATAAAAVNTQASVQSQVQAWYEGAMDRVSGWYRRETQLILFGSGLIMAIALNMDSIGLVQSFKETGTMHDAVVARAKEETAKPAPAVVVVSGAPANAAAPASSPASADAVSTAAAAYADVEKLDLPIGWDSRGMLRFKQTLGIAPCRTTPSPPPQASKTSVSGPPAKPAGTAGDGKAGPPHPAPSVVTLPQCTSMQALVQQSLADDFATMRDFCLEDLKAHNWPGALDKDRAAADAAKTRRDAANATVEKAGGGAAMDDALRARQSSDKALLNARAKLENDMETARKASKACLVPDLWTKARLESRYADARGWLQLWTGWLITAFALTLGAPFWFDTLNKLVVIRSTVKPDEKGKEVGSKDGPKK